MTSFYIVLPVIFLDSTSKKELTHTLTLYFSLTRHVEIPVGAWTEFEGARYELMLPENFKKHSTRNIEYTLIMDDESAHLKKYKHRDTSTGKLKFSLTDTPALHLKMLVDNLNQRETGWSVGAYIEATGKVISYNHTSSFDALNLIAETFNTEWEIVGKVINLKKVEYNKDNPLPLSYGRGNGFKSGLGRSNFNDTNPVEILFVQGGDRNIDASKYGSTELLLPKKQTIGYDGQYFSDQEGYNSAKAHQYVTDEDGFSLRRSDKALITYTEDSLDCSHIHPSRTGTISSVVVVDADKHFYDFTDSSIPEELNYEDYIIAGESLTVIFQDGMLAGKELEVKYRHAGRHFEIVPQEIDGRKMPDSIFKPVVGGKYAVFGMMLPDAYICDNNTKTGASWDMFREAVKYKYENEDQKFTFSGELDGVWAKKDWLNIGGRIKPGGYILFTDNQFQPDGVLIRIVGIKDYINNPHSPVIELSNVTVGGSVYSDLKKIEENEVVAENQYRSAILYAKRGWANAVESLGIMGEAMLKNFTESISPITVRTMAALIGDASLQFWFVSSKTNPQPVDHRVLFDNETKVLTAPAGIIQHKTLGITEAAPAHAASEYKYWDLAKYVSPPLDDTKKYYLYVKASTSSQAGQFYLSETAKAMYADAGYYYLWLGFLNSAYDGERTDFVNVNSFTEILPGQMTINLIRDSLAKLVIDLKNARIIAQGGAEIIGKITFSAGSSGYDNLEDKPNLSSYDEAVNYIDNVLPASLERLQAQIDDTVESHFYHYDPTLSNTPASDWTTAALKEAHLDDTFTNLDSGQSWRFTKDTGNVYSWTLMDDSAATKALVLAGQAQDTADGKRRVFVATPYPPYDVGDLWVQGTGGDLMRCQTERLSGSYVAGDWVKATKYTDDSALSTFVSVTYANQVTDLKSQIDGKIESWFQTTDPSATWTTAALKTEHTGDMWYNSSTKLLKRYTGSAWTTIEDQKAVDAYDAASNAQDTADGKRRVFTETPTTPYDVGDLWAQGMSGDLMKCKTTRASGSYNSSDWEKASKYTDDTKANSAYGRAGDALSAAEAASNAANTAASTASSASTAAANAQTAANDKAKVFYGTSGSVSGTGVVTPPTGVTGMKTNDLYVNGQHIFRYNGTVWVVADKFTIQETIANGGVVSTGAVIFGSTGGMSADGTVRIWAGGSDGSPNTGTFRVKSDGSAYARNSISIENPNGTVVCGFSSDGTNAGSSFDNPGSIRIWAGSTTPEAGYFKVTNYGMVFGKQFITNGARGRMDDMGFQFGEYVGSDPYAFLHTNHNPLFRLRSNYVPLEIQCNAGYSAVAINIENVYGWDNATFQLGYYRYSSEEFGRPFIKMINPIWKSYFPSASTKNVVWDSNTGYFMIE
jgi:hypothetical protein